MNSSGRDFYGPLLHVRKLWESPEWATANMYKVDEAGLSLSVTTNKLSWPRWSPVQYHNNYHQQQNKKASKFPTREGCLLGGPPSNMVGSMGKMSVPLYDPWDSVFGLKRGRSEKDLWNKIVFLKFKTQHEYVLIRKLLLEIQKLTRHRHKASFEDGAYRIR